MNRGERRAALRRAEKAARREKPLAGAALREEIKKWDRVLAARPGDCIARCMRALHLGTANRWGEALRDVERALREVPHGHPAEVDLIALRAMARREMGKLEEALADLDLLVRVKVNAMHLAARGEVRRRLGDLAGARPDLDRSIEMSPADPFAYLARGRVSFFEDQPEAAIDDFNAALEIDPDSIAAYHHRARAREQLGDVTGGRADRERALQLAREALARDPADTKSRTWIAWICAAETGEELDEALRLMEEVRAQASDFEERADYLETLGRVHFRLGHQEEALRLYEQARARCPSDVDVRRRYEEVRCGAGMG
jgi:tetratricopeptide (TPR) repeat protein